MTPSAHSPIWIFPASHVNTQPCFKNLNALKSSQLPMTQLPPPQFHTRSHTYSHMRAHTHVRTPRRTSTLCPPIPWISKERVWCSTATPRRGGTGRVLREADGAHVAVGAAEVVDLSARAFRRGSPPIRERGGMVGGLVEMRNQPPPYARLCVGGCGCA